MEQHKTIAIRELEAEEENLLAQLIRVRASLQALKGPGMSEVRQPPRTKPDYLLRHLLKYPEGVRLKDVPRKLEEEGFPCRAAYQSVNWLYQLPSEKQYFVMDGRLVKLRTDLIRIVENGAVCWTVPAQNVDPAPALADAPASRKIPQSSSTTPQ